MADQKRLRDCKKLRFTIYERGKSGIVNSKSEIRKSRSSVWLEHYTDNVGVSSSNLLGTTFWSGKQEAQSRKHEVPGKRKEEGKSFKLSPLSFHLINSGD